jgi:transcriptional regulator with XRE-family HTH domain
MTKPWRAIKAKTRHKLTDVERAEDAAWVRSELLQMSLREIRSAQGKTQADVAEKLDKTQGELSRIGRREDLLLSTLRDVEALGGKLQIVADFGRPSVPAARDIARLGSELPRVGSSRRRDVAGAHAKGYSAAMAPGSRKACLPCALA